jgi:hypothetical protein
VQQELTNHQLVNLLAQMLLLDIMFLAQDLQLKLLVQQELTNHQLVNLPALMPLLDIT